MTPEQKAALEAVKAAVANLEALLTPAA